MSDNKPTERQVNTAWSWTFPNGDLADHQAFMYRHDVIFYVGRMFNTLDPKSGWKTAYKGGIRAVKVNVVKVD